LKKKYSNYAENKIKDKRQIAFPGWQTSHRRIQGEPKRKKRKFSGRGKLMPKVIGVLHGAA